MNNDRPGPFFGRLEEDGVTYDDAYDEEGTKPLPRKWSFSRDALETKHPRGRR